MVLEPSYSCHRSLWWLILFTFISFYFHLLFFLHKFPNWYNFSPTAPRSWLYSPDTHRDRTTRWCPNFQSTMSWSHQGKKVQKKNKNPFPETSNLCPLRPSKVSFISTLSLLLSFSYLFTICIFWCGHLIALSMRVYMVVVAPSFNRIALCIGYGLQLNLESRAETTISSIKLSLKKNCKEEARDFWRWFTADNCKIISDWCPIVVQLLRFSHVSVMVVHPSGESKWLTEVFQPLKLCKLSIVLLLNFILSKRHCKSDPLTINPFTRLTALPWAVKTKK